MYNHIKLDTPQKVKQYYTTELKSNELESTCYFFSSMCAPGGAFGFMIVLQFETLVEFEQAESCLLKTGFFTAMYICNSGLVAVALTCTASSLALPWPWTLPSFLVPSPASSSKPLQLGRNAPAPAPSDPWASA